jgi:hypothetical protein
MGGLVSKKTAPAPAPVKEEPKVVATQAETQSALQRQASLRAMRGRGGVINTLGSTQDKLGGQ